MEHFRKIPVKTFYLKFEGTVPVSIPKLEVVEWKTPLAADYLKLYMQVGKPWGWAGRLLLNESELQQKLNAKENRIWRCYYQNNLLGFFENDYSEEGKCEIVYLGLVPEFIGKRLGKPLLSAAINKASNNCTNQVWLHTCEFDHENALALYIHAGFVVIQEIIENEYYPIDFIERQKNKGIK